MSKYLVGIHPANDGFFAPRWKKYLEERDISVKEVDLLANDALAQCEGCDAVMWHWNHAIFEQRLVAHPILESLERYKNLVVFPNSATSWHYDDKIAQKFIFEALGVPQPDSWVFTRREDVASWMEKAPLPVVAKTYFGAGSRCVSLIETPDALQEYVDDAFERGIGGDLAYARASAFKYFKRPGRSFPYRLASYIKYRYNFGRSYVTQWPIQKHAVYFQGFIKDNPFDIRVTVIGDRAFIFRRHNRPNDFRASGSGLIDYAPHDNDKDCALFAHEVARKVNSQSCALDLLETEEGFVVIEMSYCFNNKPVYDCPGHWDDKGNWHEGHMWPEEAHVDVLLKQLENKSQ